MNYLKIFRNSFLDNWDRPAVTDLKTGLTLTYGGLGARIQRVRKLLELLDVKPGTHVAIVGTNSIDWITNYMATLLHGCVAVTVQVMYEADEMLSLLAAADVEILFAEPAYLPEHPDFEMMPALKLVLSQDVQQIIYNLDDSYPDATAAIVNLDLRFAEYYPHGFLPSDVRVDNVQGETPVAIFFTSGTVGTPRPVVLTADAIEGNIIHGLKVDLFPQGDRVLTSSSMGNVWGAIYNVLLPLASGAHTFVFREFFFADPLLKALKRVRPHRILMTPRMMRETYRLIEQRISRSAYYRIIKSLPLVGQPLYRTMIRREYNRAIGGRCREIIAGSTNIERALKYKLHRVGLRFTVSYGLTESGGLVCYAPCGDFVPSTVGQSVNDLVKCRIRPMQFEGLPEGAGILEVSGMALMKEYYNDPEGTAEAFTDDGWLSTRDIATIDASGYVTIIGRLDTIIKRRGGVIVPERLEATIMEHPGIESVVVVDREGELTAIVNVESNIPTDLADETVRKAIEAVNASTPSFIHIDGYEISATPLARTLKWTVARYHYM